jgi:hypothetical protein
MINPKLFEIYTSRLNELTAPQHSNLNIVLALANEIPSIEMSQPRLAVEWLGFVQGYCWTTGIFTLGEIKEHMRLYGEPLTRFTFAVAGISHHTEDYTKAAVKEGDEMSLELEPDNKVDPSAIKVLKAGVHIGYVPKAQIAEVRSLMAGFKGRLVASTVQEHDCAVTMECMEQRK